MYYWRALLGTATFTAAVKASDWLFLPTGAMLRFSCSELVVERLDPVVFPGVAPSPHLHQVSGGDAFNVTMDTSDHDIPSTATCTTCTPIDDFSNYWTAVLFFRAQNGTFKRVNTVGDGLGFNASNGGQTVYYLTNGSVTAFAPGFRMTVGNPSFKTAAQLEEYPLLFFTCLENPWTRNAGTTQFPNTTCAGGIMATIRFPTFWNGVDLDSADHQSHTAYPSSNGTCPDTHPVTIPQVFIETFWDTTPFNDESLWPTDGSQPFWWSFNDNLGYGIHADYVYGWKGDSLQKALDANCTSDLIVNNLNCSVLPEQTIEQANQCTQASVIEEDIDAWLPTMPGQRAASVKCW